MAQCNAKTKDGRLCQIPAQDGQRYCHVHRKQRLIRNALSLSALGALLLGAIGLIANIMGILGYIGVNPEPSPLPSPMENSATQSALATPTFLPPTGAVELPSSQEDVLSVVINPYSINPFEGIITRDLDPSNNPKITITKEDVVLVGDVSPKISFVGNDALLIFEIYLTGKAVDEEVQVTNRIPIRVTYEAMPDGASLYKTGRPGGGYFYGILGADVSSKSQQVWAVNSPEIRERFQMLEQNCPECIDPEGVCPLCVTNGYELPSEITRSLSSNNENFPDYFLLKKNEKIGIPVVVFFQEAGIYHLQIGVEYIYRQYKTITWAEPEVQVYVPKNYYVWMCGNPNESSCEIEPACVINSDGTLNCDNFINP